MTITESGLRGQHISAWGIATRGSVALSLHNGTNIDHELALI